MYVLSDDIEMLLDRDNRIQPDDDDEQRRCDGSPCKGFRYSFVFIFFKKDIDEGIAAEFLSLC